MILNVNVDHVATLRNARDEGEPNVVEAALIAEKSGAGGIVCHLREDRRHIRDEDVYALRDNISTRLDLEMANDEEIIKIALDVVPELVTIVPEKREELTTEGGLDVFSNAESLKKLIDRMHNKNIEVSLFIEADSKQIEKSAEIGADLVEIHTGTYANLKDEEEIKKELKRIETAVDLSNSHGMKVAAGHGLNLQNTHAIALIPGINELSIGHSLISNSIFLGLDRTIDKFLKLMND